MPARRYFLMALLLVASACGSDDSSSGSAAPTTSPVTAGATTVPGTPASTAPAPAGPVRLEVTEVARNLDTVWSLAWDPQGALWYTERGGRLGRVGGPSRSVSGVAESGEAGLMGLEIDRRGRMFVMYTSGDDNRIVRFEADGSQRILVDGIAKSSIHDGGRLRFGPDGQLYASTGDAAQPELADVDSSLNGKVLRVDPDSGRPTMFSKGHRNVQGLCFAPDGRLFATEHGPSGRDEVNLLREGFDGGWPETAGNGIRNYTPSVAPAGCTFYSAELIPQWKGSLLFVTLRGESLRRLTVTAQGTVAGEEVLYDEEYGRPRDVAVGPDGAVYLTTSNRDGRGSPSGADDRILRIAPAG
ncbi:MAG TPA: PQQ-dependent sugar dehydrogenase [Acidimicrobiales bacterium]|nr:PQQ-dependent sugar dehydrogenase [Acidimicrobiales bacterium]